METPNLTAIDFQNEFKQVYEPAEDSFLLLDALEADLSNIRAMNPAVCLEIGCGSGVIITALARTMKDTLFFATDVNQDACRSLIRCCQSNQITACVQPIVTDLDASVHDRLLGQVDLMVFNPPYVPTENNEVSLWGISRAWAGGIDGRIVIDRFLDRCLKLLSSNGRLYLLLVKENLPDQVMLMLKQKGFDSEIVIKRKCRNEHLMIVRAIKSIESK